MRGLFTAAAALLALVSPGAAFELEGYRSGMSLEQIAAIAAEQGDTLYESATSYAGVEFEGFFTVVRADGKELSLSLCDDRLHSVYTLMDGGFHTFAKTATSLTAQYGPPMVDTQSSPAEAAPPLTSSVSLTWRTPDGEEVSIHLDAQGEMSPLMSYGLSAIETVCSASPEAGEDRAAT